jgi:hypothetical protein
MALFFGEHELCHGNELVNLQSSYDFDNELASS